VSYYRSPDDLPGEADPPVAGEPVAPPMAGSADDEAKRKRRQRIIAACVAVDVVVLIAVLAVFVL